MTADALSFSGVTHKYGARAALASVTVNVRAGEMFGLIGPDGAGKTTAIRLACGLLRPDGGDVRVFGQDPAAEHRAITALVGYLSQRFSLYGDLSIDENIAFQAEIHGVRGYAAERDRLLAITQLTPFRSRRADRLSGGMKQKLALACTLIHRPKLLLLDEPTTGVDPVSRREFWKLLSEFLAAGLTIVMATPTFLLPLWLNAVGSGIFWPGITQGLVNLLMDRAPSEGRGAYVAAFGAVSGLGTFVASMLGGAIAMGLGETLISLGPITLNHYAILFVASSVGRAAMALVFARRL